MVKVGVDIVQVELRNKDQRLLTSSRPIDTVR